MENKTGQELNQFYAEQYRRIQEGNTYITLQGILGVNTYSRKQETIHDLILRNTIMMSNIVVSEKSLLIAKVSGNQIEVSYFTRALIFHCQEIFRQNATGITNSIIKILFLFSHDLIKPPSLTRLLINKIIIKKVSRRNYLYCSKLKKALLLTDKKGSGMQRYEILQSLDEDKIIAISSGVIDEFISLNTRLVELLQYMETANNKYSGYNN